MELFIFIKKLSNHASLNSKRIHSFALRLNLSLCNKKHSINKKIGKENKNHLSDLEPKSSK